MRRDMSDREPTELGALLEAERSYPDEYSATRASVRERLGATIDLMTPTHGDGGTAASDAALPRAGLTPRVLLSHAGALLLGVAVGTGAGRYARLDVRMMDHHPFPCDIARREDVVLADHAHILANFQHSFFA